MRWTIKNSLYFGFVLLGILVIVFASIARLAHFDADATQEDILRTSNLMREMELLKVSSLEISMIQRAYVISGDAKNIAQLPAMRVELNLHQKNVAAAIAGDAELSLRFRNYSTCLGLRRAFVDKVIGTMKNRGFAAAKALESTGEDDRLMGCIEAQINAMQVRALTRMQAQETANRNLQKRIARTELLTVLLALALLIGMGIKLTAVTIANTHLYTDLVHRSSFDQLTDIPNRHNLEQRLQALLECSAAGDSIFALIYIDLDHFKQVNDQYGHIVGDLFLQHAVRRMKNQLRPGDMLARLGGDEFAALIVNIPDRAHAMEIVTRLEQAFARPFNIQNRQIQGSASMGIALYPQDGRDIDALLNTADSEMYAVKDTHHQQRI